VIDFDTRAIRDGLEWKWNRAKRRSKLCVGKTRHQHAIFQETDIRDRFLARVALAVALADNQRPNFEAFTKADVALGAGIAGDQDLGDAIETAVKRLAEDSALRAAMGARGRALVDGGGACRVASLICRPIESRMP